MATPGSPDQGKSKFWYHAGGMWAELPEPVRSWILALLAPVAVTVTGLLQGLRPFTVVTAVLLAIAGTAITRAWLAYLHAWRAAERAREAYWQSAPPPSRTQPLAAAIQPAAVQEPSLLVKGFGGQRAQLEIAQQAGASGYVSVRARVESCSGISAAKHRATFVAYHGQTRPGQVTVATLATFSHDRWLTINENAWKVPNAQAEIRMTFSIEWDRGSELQTLEAGDCLIITAPWESTLAFTVTLAAEQ